MNFAAKLSRAVKKSNSLVCISLDPDMAKLPEAVGGSQWRFNKAVIDSTQDLVSAYKLNSAFYEADGARGIEQLKRTCEYLLRVCPEIPIILDAKRGDIGNTNAGYARFAFDWLGVDGITLHPYMGRESLRPFLDMTDKGIFILCRTSNEGAGEFQDLVTDGLALYQQVATHVAHQWNEHGNCMLVVGATYPKELATIRKIVGGKMTILVPGAGAQGGGVAAVMKAGLGDDNMGLVINSGRSILFASSGADFAEAARTAAQEFRDSINKFRS